MSPINKMWEKCRIRFWKSSMDGSQRSSVDGTGERIVGSREARTLHREDRVRRRVLGMQ